MPYLHRHFLPLLLPEALDKLCRIPKAQNHKAQDDGEIRKQGIVPINLSRDKEKGCKKDKPVFNSQIPLQATTLPLLDNSSKFLQPLQNPAGRKGRVGTILEFADCLSLSLVPPAGGSSAFTPYP